MTINDIILYGATGIVLMILIISFVGFFLSYPKQKGK